MLLTISSRSKRVKIKKRQIQYANLTDTFKLDNCFVISAYFLVEPPPPFPISVLVKHYALPSVMSSIHLSRSDPTVGPHNPRSRMSSDSINAHSSLRYVCMYA